MRPEKDLLEQSPWFDADWYSTQYPDVALSGLTPEAHYLRVGEPLGRRPCPSFDPAWYLAEYPDIAQAGVSPLLHFITHGEKEGRLPCGLEAQRWDSALWRQTEPVAACLQALEGLSAGTSLPEASYAGFALGRWYAWQGEWARAAACLARRPSGKGGLPSHHGPELLTVEAFGRSGQLARAWQALATLQEHAPEWPDTRLAVANLLAWQAAVYPEAGADRQGEWQRQRLAWVNGGWAAHGLTEVELADPESGLGMDNLGVSSSEKQSPDKSGSYEYVAPEVTVIVPAFKAASTLPTALRSLAAQRGVRLEVIVVDDASPDNTAAVAEAFAASDARFRLIRQPSNQGAYAARNRGLAEARGEFITVHDSDDWSHPDKLATQLAGLEAHPEWQACCSHWGRCTPELIFGRWRMEEGWIYRNVSSLMFRREVFEALGYWDRVRVEADTEYYYRIRAAFGDQSIGEVLPGVPLAFGRTVADSLTAVGATHLVTQFGGVRADYREASQAWHRAGAGQPERLYLPAEPAERPFTVPESMLP
ncbi:glycosyltransferase family 2 protein [Halomonas halodenitrificans]|uniref:glycosyltransferase family 2 protein n=1 Tax=Halomonas halodenitrificans TaxID=28252 RepID=UPI0006845C01|nr:glycosyltransferase family A protein [Halomonas halodenitrificans]